MLRSRKNISSSQIIFSWKLFKVCRCIWRNIFSWNSK